MSIENIINNKLNTYPIIKKVIKRCYQLLMCTFFTPPKSEGNIIRITPNDKYEYFFGYYDKSPWSMDEGYMLCLRVKCTNKNVAPKDIADIMLINVLNNYSMEKIAETKTWNIQQGCMLQWIGPDYDKEIIYNDFRDDQYVSVILNIVTRTEKVISCPVYSVANKGDFALSLDFSRLHHLRPGYGYSNIDGKNNNINLPSDDCIWYVDLESGEIKSLFKYTDFYNFEQKDSMINAKHKVNHIMINQNDSRFIVLHRWFTGNQKHTRLLSCDINGKNLFNLSDDDMVSHCYWKNNNEIIAFENKEKSGIGYYLMEDKTSTYIHLWKEVNSDGHPSYSPNGKYVITDTYPNGRRISSIMLLEESGRIEDIAKVYSPFKYDNNVRCDLHPRWDRKSEKICFDAVFEGKRELYIANIREHKV